MTRSESRNAGEAESLNVLMIEYAPRYECGHEEQLCYRILLDIPSDVLHQQRSNMRKISSTQ
jgi:hypothetical protein